MRTRLIICDFDLDERDVYQFKSLIDQEKLQEMTMATIEQDIAALKERADLQ